MPPAAPPPPPPAGPPPAAGPDRDRFWTRAAFPLLDTIPDAVVVVDSAGTIVYANRLVEDVFGYPPDEVLGRSVEVLIPESYRDAHRRHRHDYERHRAMRPMGSGGDLRGLHRDGHEFPIDTSLSPIESDEGPLVIAAARDMTERRRIEQTLRSTNDKLRRDINGAARIQRSLLPGRPANVPGIDVEWVFEPCDRLGGDSFNVFAAADGIVGFYMLDVTGHGMVTALQSVALTRILAATWQKPDDPAPARLAARLNTEFPIDVDAWEYFTFLGGVLNLTNASVRYVSAGHHGPILAPAGGAPRALEAAGLPIGMFPEANYEEFTAPVGPGDRLYLFSDGLSEAMNESDEDFGIPRLLDTLAAVADRPLGETVRAVRRAVDHWCGDCEVHDDLTLVAIEVRARQRRPPTAHSAASASQPPKSDPPPSS